MVGENHRLVPAGLAAKNFDYDVNLIQSRRFGQNDQKGETKMSFRTHAAGSSGFRYERDNCPDEDVFEAAAVISALNASGPSVGGAVEGAADYVLPSVGVLDGVSSVASTEMIHLLRSTVSFLAMNRNTNRGWISVSTRAASAVWADSTGFATYYFLNDADPGGEFIRTILPSMRESGFENYGTFRALAMAITAYDAHRPSSGPPTLLIQLSK